MLAQVDKRKCQIYGYYAASLLTQVPSDSCPPFPFQTILPNQVPKVPPQDGGSFTIMCPDNEVKYYACPGKQNM